MIVLCLIRTNVDCVDEDASHGAFMVAFGGVGTNFNAFGDTVGANFNSIDDGLLGARFPGPGRGHGDEELKLSLISSFWG